MRFDNSPSGRAPEPQHQPKPVCHCNSQNHGEVWHGRELKAHPVAPLLWAGNLALPQDAPRPVQRGRGGQGDCRRWDRGLEEVSAPGRAGCAKPDKADMGERRDRWIDGSISRDEGWEQRGQGGSQDVEGHGAALPWASPKSSSPLWYCKSKDQRLHLSHL